MSASTATTWARALGFHTPVLAFALRTALAAFAALLLAYALGLEHPHWAAMSAWACSQPMREHLLARGIYRFAGSVVGVAFAVGLVLLAQESIWVLALGLAAWSALCAFLGNLQRGYMAYGCMLAGYSAAMVILLHVGPVAAIWPFAWDRLLTVVTGVLTAMCISWCFAPRRRTAVLIAQSRHALAGVLQAAIAPLRPHAAPAPAPMAALLSRLAEVEELLELYPEGSRTARHTSRAMHWQQHRALDLVYHLGLLQRVEVAVDLAPEGPAEQLVQALESLVQALQAAPESQQAQALRQCLQQAIAACEAAVAAVQAAGQAVPEVLHALYLLLQAMHSGWEAEQRDLQGRHRPVAHERRMAPLPLHRDWVGARQAAVRAGGTLLLLGMVWALTEWRLVAFGMLGLSVMLLVFSGFESPHRTMAFVLRGQLIGAALALLCQTLVWPWAQSGWQMVWMLLPFALLGGLVFAHQRTAAGAMDTNMAMFILLAPVFPQTGGWTQHLSMALAVVSGPALAWLVYRGVYPTNAQRRLHTLARMMLAEVPALARRLLEEGRPALWPGGSAAAALWQAQLHHRLLRLVRWADKTQWPARGQLHDLGLSLRAMQTALLQLQQWRRDTILATPALRRTERLAVQALQRTAAWGGAARNPRQQVRLQAAWRALSAQPGLPPALAAQALQVAQRDIPALEAVRQQLP